jgi:hypothetical protein
MGGLRVRWSTGPYAGVSVQPAGQSGPPTLVMYADPNTVTLLPPANQAEYPSYAGFLRELATGAHQIAAVLDPAGEPGRHTFGDSAGR